MIISPPNFPAAEMDANQYPDRFSLLPKDILLHILSFLPSQHAARTSVLARCFRNLWKLSPVLDLHLSIHPSVSSFINAADSALLNRNSEYPLHRLTLNMNVNPRDRGRFNGVRLCKEYVNWLLVLAGQLGVQYLTVEYLHNNELDDPLPAILSIPSLKYLSLSNLSRPSVFPAVFAATGIKVLSLCFPSASFQPDGLNTFLAKLVSLEELELFVPVTIDVRSETVKRLKLHVVASPNPDVGIGMPKLEVLEFCGQRITRIDIHVEMPMLRIAKMHFVNSHKKTAPAIWKMVRAVSNVEQLRIVVPENCRFRPIHTILEPEVEPPQFPNLKHLDIEMCFYGPNKEDLITLLRNSPAIESLRLIHKDPKCKVGASLVVHAASKF